MNDLEVVIQKVHDANMTCSATGARFWSQNQLYYSKELNWWRKLETLSLLLKLIDFAVVTFCYKNF